jgi:hypothetical protein
MYFKSKQPREVREMMQREEALTLHISPSTNSIVEFRSRKKIQKEILIVINFLFLLLMSNFINAQTVSYRERRPLHSERQFDLWV